MFGFLNINMRNFPKNNTAIIHQAIDKMNKGNLNTTDILDSEELITDVKSSISQLGSFFNEPNHIKDLMDFILKEPLEDEHKRGHKFPFNACEILCSENQSILGKIFDDHKNEEEDEDEDRKPVVKKSEDEEEFDIEIGDINKKDDNENPKDIEINDDKFNVDTVLNSNFEIRDNQQTEDDLVNFDSKEEKTDKKEEPVNPFDKKDEVETEEMIVTVNVDEKKTEGEETQNTDVNLRTSVGLAQENKDELSDEVDKLKISGEKDKQELFNKVEEIVQEVETEKLKDDKEEEEIKEEIDALIGDKKKLNDSLNVSEYKIDTELLDYFFKFLDTNEELNFVLSGYFAKTFGHFLNLRQTIVMRYLLIQKPEILTNFTKHINRKSIVECIYKILISYSDDIPNSMQLKINFLKSVLAAFNPEDDDVICNISDMLVELFTVRKMYLSFITNTEVFKTIFDFVIANINNKSFAYLIKILQKANENILKDFGSNLCTPSFTCNETQEMFFNFTYNVNNLISGNTSYNSQADNPEEGSPNMQNLHQQFNSIFQILTGATEAIINNFVDETNSSKAVAFDSTYGTRQKMLGVRRLHEIEYMRSILEILVNAFANSALLGNLDLDLIVDILVKSSFFKSAIVSNIFLI